MRPFRVPRSSLATSRAPRTVSTVKSFGISVLPWHARAGKLKLRIGEEIDRVRSVTRRSGPIARETYGNAVVAGAASGPGRGEFLQRLVVAWPDLSSPGNLL